jgi:hypothetical protein
VVRADPGARWAAWDQDDLDALIDDARRWQRVGRHAMEDADALIAEVVGGLWGARADGEGGRFEVSPWVVPGWKAMALRRLRLHRTLIDIEVRPRAEWITCRLESTFGPPVALALSLRNVPAVARVTIDEVVLQGPRAIFTVSGEHEAVFYLGAPASRPQVPGPGP